ncbi:MAG TPA: CHRD domain-containing protein [Stellaceae bacterium]|nr:CHRD domain-containing protein [Stellaceae bacterium]
MRRFYGIAAGAAVVATLSLAACTSAREETKTFHATLNAAQEVPPVESKGQGTADLKLDAKSKQLTWNVTYSGLSGDAAAAHIHGPAAPGANAGVVVNLAPNGVKNPIQGSATLTDAQIADLIVGKDYINVHTAANKGGEIRGQITP